MSLEKLKSIACLKNDQALAIVNALISRQVVVSGQIGEIQENIKMLAAKAALEDQYLYEKWFLLQQQKLAVLLRLQSDLEMQVRQARKKAYAATARLDVVEKIHTQDTRNRLRKIALREV